MDAQERISSQRSFCVPEHVGKKCNNPQSHPVFRPGGAGGCSSLQRCGTERYPNDFSAAPDCRQPSSLGRNSGVFRWCIASDTFVQSLPFKHNGLSPVPDSAETGCPSGKESPEQNRGSLVTSAGSRLYFRSLANR